MLFAGDLVSGRKELYLREFFYWGRWIFGMVPILPITGNHEYDKLENQGNTFSKHWKHIFAMPLNGWDEKNRKPYLLDGLSGNLVCFC